MNLRILRTVHMKEMVINQNKKKCCKTKAKSLFIIFIAEILRYTIVFRRSFVSYLSPGGVGSSLSNPSFPSNQYVCIGPFPLISVIPLVEAYNLTLLIYEHHVFFRALTQYPFFLRSSNN